MDASIVCPRCKQALETGEFFSPTGKRYSYCRTCRNQYQSERRKLHVYGISEEMYAARLKLQGGVCAICGTKPSTKRRLAVDHDHQTGDIRGLLCHRCNQALGLMGDKPDLFLQSFRYLRRFMVDVKVVFPENLNDFIQHDHQKKAERADMQGQWIGNGATVVRDSVVQDWGEARLWCQQADEMPYEAEASAQSRAGSQFGKRRTQQTENLRGIFNAMFAQVLSVGMAKTYLQNANNSAEEVLDAMEKMRDWIAAGHPVSSPASYLLGIVKKQRGEREKQPTPIRDNLDGLDPMYADRAIMEAQREELAAKWGREDADLWFAENYKGPAA